ncbi:MAG: 4Fe-4S binding protein [Brevefilum sp.]|nr:4Fe-4S binding protein [Brevefilum sp.]
MENKAIYRSLADHLDSFPQGFPATKSGKELELLAYLFTPDEAQFALNVTLFFQPLTEVAESAGLDLADSQGLVKSMVAKGLLNMQRGNSGIEINLPPFIVGFYENQVFRIDETFAQLFEDYYREIQGELLSIQPQFHRVIPVHESINTDIEILPEEDVTAIISSKQAWAVMDCICRKQKALLDQACDHPLKVCLAMSDTPGAFDRASQMDALDLASALEVLDMAAKFGLVHTVSNQKSDISYVCNCCTCSCGLLRGISEAHIANVVARSSYFAVVDEDLCIGCGECETVCQFDAIKIGDFAMIDRVPCVGCGVCTRVCPEGAIRLIRREPEEIKPIPVSTDEWLTQRRQARGMS